MKKYHCFVAVALFLVNFLLFLSFRVAPPAIQIVDFAGFNNLTGAPGGCYLVPNYVHFVRFNKPKLGFIEAVCLLAALRHQRPDKIFVHTNVRAEGKRWAAVKAMTGMKEVLEFRTMEIPTSIYGQPLNPKWRVFHGGDVARLQILSQYGGVFLDNDSYLVRSIDRFRVFEMVLGWQPGKSLQNQVVIAHKDARLLKLWMESYKGNYRPEMWYYNAGILPTKFLEQQPHLVHRVEKLFGVYGVFRSIYEKKWPAWRNYYAVHLMIRHQTMLKNVNENATYPVVFDEHNIQRYPVAIRDMVNDVYPSNNK